MQDDRHDLDDIGDAIEAAALRGDDSAAREHLAAGFPIYYSDSTTPAGLMIKKYPDGRRELIRVDIDGEHRIQDAA